MLKETTLRREMAEVRQLKLEAMKELAERKTEGALKRVEFYFGAECALSWFLNDPESQTRRVSAA